MWISKKNALFSLSWILILNSNSPLLFLITFLAISLWNPVTLSRFTSELNAYFLAEKCVKSVLQSQTKTDKYELNKKYFIFN